MVEHEARKIMSDYYRVWGTYTVNAQGSVAVDGHVSLIKSRPRLGVKFNEITGDFGAHGKGLISLQGLPDEIGGALLINGNKLQNLVGAPRTVKGDMVISNIEHTLKSLEGAPDQVGGEFWCTYDEQLPLLRCLVAAKVRLEQPASVTAAFWDKQITCEQILNDARWMGKGKSGMLNCAIELKRAGLAGNARW
jgi:hypothetical protein